MKLFSNLFTSKKAILFWVAADAVAGVLLWKQLEFIRDTINIHEQWLEHLLAEKQLKDLYPEAFADDKDEIVVPEKSGFRPKKPDTERMTQAKKDGCICLVKQGYTAPHAVVCPARALEAARLTEASQP